MLKLISFKVHRLTDAFILGKITDPDRKFDTNWDSTNSLTLTRSINNQSINSAADVIALRGSCQDEEAPALTFYYHDGELTYREYTTDQNKKELCDKFLSIAGDYIEVLSRDQDALNQINFTVETNAVVLLYGGMYYGHIYSWVSPTNPSICFAMGIRNRIDSVFVRETSEHLPNISGYLLEGVRRFAINKGCNKIFIVNPKPIMEKILPKYGFEKQSINRSIIGKSIMSDAPVGVCNNCYTIGVSNPLIENHVVYVHYTT